MIRDSLKKLINATRPSVERIAFDTAKGYVFGCVFGVFTPSKDPLLKTMHRNGKNFAAMSALYTTTEMAFERLREKDDAYNSIMAGAVAGAAGSYQGTLSGSCVFGTYSGLSHYLSKNLK